ncbi:hypothetical protein GPK34_00010 [Secundilactobacillus kimchicus]|uniref:hypothetical protein n=1 Tax=Secundilactobacillus kimchicus TaxID=528209 RepID=UPI001C02CAB6|nr:hypothetical protein [Secundilactobacillus kimchicus]MBT9670419.1 hypothetical protein [Secundilactobacillus kimchicus]
MKIRDERGRSSNTPWEIGDVVSSDYGEAFIVAKFDVGSYGIVNLNTGNAGFNTYGSVKGLQNDLAEFHLVQYEMVIKDGEADD